MRPGGPSSMLTAPGPLAQHDTVTRASILPHLPRIVLEHMSWVAIDGLRNMASQQATFWIRHPHCRSFTLTDEQIQEIFDLYLVECERQKAYDAAVAVAFCSNVERVSAVKHLIPQLSPRVFGDALLVLARRGCWGIVTDLARGRPRAILQDVLQYAVLCCSHCTDPTLNQCLGLLLTLSHDDSALKQAAASLVSFCRESLVEVVLSRDDVDPSRWWWRWRGRGRGWEEEKEEEKEEEEEEEEQRRDGGWPLNLLGMVTVRLAEDVKRNRGLHGWRPDHPSPRHCQLLTLTLQAGLSTAHERTCRHEDRSVPFHERPTPLLLAVCCGMAPLVRLFYKVGATSNRELFQLSRQLSQDCGAAQIISSDQDPRSAQVSLDQNPRSAQVSLDQNPRSAQVSLDQDPRSAPITSGLAEELHRAARNPRGLLELCVLTVSRCVGCGGGRERRVRALPLTAVLQNEVLFVPALSEFHMTLCCAK